MGILALAGWVTGLRLLAGIRADFIPMAPNTAIGFILLGCALAANPAEYGDRTRRLIVAVASAIVLLLTTVRVIEYTFSVDLGVNGWFFRAPAEMFGLASVGRMSLFTALIFELASLSVLGLALNRGQSNRDWAGVGGLAVAIFGRRLRPGILLCRPFVLRRLVDPDGPHDRDGLRPAWASA